MKYEEALKRGTDMLSEAGVEDAPIDSFLLLEKITGFGRAEYLLKKNREISNEEISSYIELIERRKKREPCQYITGNAEFMGLPFKVDRNVLVPRQDTETLVETALSLIKQSGAKKILDLCTGSGAIAISIKHYFKEADVFASDISDAALKVAKENADINGTDIGFISSNMFENIIDTGFDIIISNPPYVTDDEYEQLMPEVKNYEPALALKAGEDGLDFYKIIAKKAPEHLNSEGYLLLEIGCSQAEALEDIFDKNFDDIRIIKDLSGNDRVLNCRLK